MLAISALRSVEDQGSHPAFIRIPQIQKTLSPTPKVEDNLHDGHEAPSGSVATPGQ